MSLNANVRKFDPLLGQAFQGDLAIVSFPESVKLNTANEIQPKNGYLILLEGELTGHHHAIPVLDHPATPFKGDAPAKPTKTSKKVEDLFAAATQAPSTAKLFRDANVASEMQRLGILTRTDLMVAVLSVSEGNGVILRHHEHDGIHLPAGNYYIGRQVESAFNEERRVAD